MSRFAYYLTHPQVNVDANVDVPKWGLSEIGKSRVMALIASGSAKSSLRNIKHIISSGETKAIETAKPIADFIGCGFETVENMHENDRSATGFLPPDEFEIVADQFFANPDENIRGWESANDAQSRILTEVENCLLEYLEGDIMFVGHGGVGTLLYCALSGNAINRKFDQGPQNGGVGGGNFFSFDPKTRKALHHWRAMEKFN